MLFTKFFSNFTDNCPVFRIIFYKILVCMTKHVKSATFIMNIQTRIMNSFFNCTIYFITIIFFLAYVTRKKSNGTPFKSYISLLCVLVSGIIIFLNTLSVKRVYSCRYLTTSCRCHTQHTPLGYQLRKQANQ